MAGQRKEFFRIRIQSTDNIGESDIPENWHPFGKWIEFYIEIGCL